jgi:hypothetical protein
MSDILNATDISGKIYASSDDNSDNSDENWNGFMYVSEYMNIWIFEYSNIAIPFFYVIYI